MRDRILTAATNLFAQEGFDGATVRAIADQCGLTDAALYYYFPTKRAILEALLDRPRQSLPRPGNPGALFSARWLDALVDVTLDEIAAEGPLFRIILDQALDGDRTALALRAKTASAWRRALTVAFAHGDEPEVVEARVDAFMMLIHGAVLSVYIDRDIAFKDLAGREDVRSHIKDVILAALQPGSLGTPTE